MDGIVALALAALVLAALLLGGCSKLYVDVQFVPDEAALRRACGDDMKAEPLGCAKSHSKSCTIVAYEPRSFDDHRRVETLGHELLHCLKGPAHT